MPSFRILLEENVRTEINIDADSYEEAATEAKVQARSMKITISSDGKDKKTYGSMEATWIGTEEHVESMGEFEFEIESECVWCNTALLSRTISEQPWNYAGDPKSEHTGLVCYPCLKKDGWIKEDGRTLKESK